MHLDVSDFLPADKEEKQSLVIMRESVGFWRDGARRFKKNKIAMTSLIIIILVFIFLFYPAILLSCHEQQIRGSENLSPFNTRKPSLREWRPGKRISSLSWNRLPGS